MLVNIYKNILAYKQVTIKQVSMKYLSFHPAPENSVFFTLHSQIPNIIPHLSVKSTAKDLSFFIAKVCNCFFTLNLAATYQGLGNHSIPLYALSQTYS